MRLAGAVLAVLLLAAAGAQAAGGPTVVSAAFNKHLKTDVLVNAKGRTLYMFVQDRGPVSACHVADGCAQAWPALLTKGLPKAGTGVKASLLGSAKRKDGGTQVMYAGHLLYTWVGGFGLVGDEKAGDANGQGVVGEWWAVSPAGKPIKKKPTP